MTLLTLTRSSALLSVVIMLTAAVSFAQRISYDQVSANAVPVEIVDFVPDDQALADGVGGQVIVTFKLTVAGIPADVKVKNGPAYPCGSNPNGSIEKVKAGVKVSVANARFEPILEKGVPVERQVTFTVDLDKNLAKSQRASEAPAEGPSKAKLVRAGILNGRAMKLLKPTMPIGATAAQPGPVTVAILLDESGKVVRSGIISGDAVYADAARIAACGSTFRPTTLSGEPVRVSGVLTYMFVSGAM